MFNSKLEKRVTALENKLRPNGWTLWYPSSAEPGFLENALKPIREDIRLINAYLNICKQREIVRTKMVKCRKHKQAKQGA